LKKVVKKAIVYIGLGSNLEQPVRQIKNAITALEGLADTRVLSNSGYFTSKPMGPEDQPDYVNAVVELETALPAIELLKFCQQIETKQGRIKKRFWGERTIDLDILLYADLQIDSADLQVPHPGILQRDFVFMPLLKLNPEITIPGKGLLKAIIGSERLSSNGAVNADFGCQFAGNIE
jgi:2-amino-4-hydroxy-6-hydroxymethyldihydropteridine diphosphokinase